MNDCAFCKIINGEEPAKIVYQDDYIISFHSIANFAPKHILVMSKKHGDRINGHMIEVAYKVAESLGLDKTGYRLVHNVLGTEGNDAHVTVNHPHLHILGGKYLGIKFAG